MSLETPSSWPIAVAVGFAVLAAVAALFLGPVDVLVAFTGDGDPAQVETARAVIVELRLPRVLLGLLVGGALALSGVILQALLRNDLAEPYLVGVGPGAFLGVTLAALLLGGAGTLPPPAARAAFAFAGALAVSALVFGMVRRNARATGPTLLLVGVAVGAFASAVATAALYIAVADWHRVVYWLLGHLGPRTAGDLTIVAVVLVGAFVWAFVRARDLDAVALGEEAAWLVGVNVRRLVVSLGLVACLLAAAAVSVAGLIGFVGLLVPHLARGLVGPGHRRLLPAAAALGAGLLVLADAGARIVHPPLELPVGVVTAALGAPALAWILLRKG